MNTKRTNGQNPIYYYQFSAFMPRRLLSVFKLYSNEMLKPSIRIVTSILMNMLVIVYAKIPFNGPLFIQGFLTIFFILLYYRLSDEFKDYETDIKYFPERPIPQGKITLGDLNWFIAFVTLMLVLVNSFNDKTYLSFSVLFLFAFGMGKWFFLEKFIAHNRLLAFLTHLPIGFIMTGYLQNLYGQDAWLTKNILLNVMINLPGLNWEILRKTFPAQLEKPGYQTYSSLLGFRLSILLSMIFVFSISGLQHFLFGSTQLGSILIHLINILMTILLSMILIKKEEIILKNQSWSEIYGMIIFGLFLMNGL